MSTIYLRVGSQHRNTHTHTHTHIVNKTLVGNTADKTDQLISCPHTSDIKPSQTWQSRQSACILSSQSLGATALIASPGARPSATRHRHPYTNAIASGDKIHDPLLDLRQKHMTGRPEFIVKEMACNTQLRDGANQVARAGENLEKQNCRVWSGSPESL